MIKIRKFVKSINIKIVAAWSVKKNFEIENRVLQSRQSFDVGIPPPPPPWTRVRLPNGWNANLNIDPAAKSLRFRNFQWLLGRDIPNYFLVNMQHRAKD
jgi:hypothetical protein